MGELTTTRVLISENEPGELDALESALAGAGGQQIVGLTHDGLETAQSIAQLRPDVALVRAQMPGMDGFQVCRLSALTAPETICVLVMDTPEEEASFRLDAMRSGARGLVHRNTPAQDLLRLLDDLLKLRPRRDDDDFRLITDVTRTPVVITVTGAKGGIGKTTISTNLAVALAQEHPDQVVLVDFLGQYGDVKLLLDLHAGGGLLDLLQYEEIDSELVQGKLLRHESGLRVLGGVNGPDALESLDEVRLPQIAQILGALRRTFRYIVIDAQPLAPPFSRYLLQRSNWVVLVSTLTDLSTIRNTGALLSSLLNGLVAPEKIKLVANRVDGTNPFGVADLEQATKTPVDVRLPEAREVVVTALNSGQPFVMSKPQAPISRGLRELAGQLTGQSSFGSTPAAPAAPPRRVVAGGGR